MNHEVTENLVGEKMMKRFLGFGQPNSAAIRAGKANLGYHLDYIGYLIERRRWLAGDHFSLADITAAAHLSSLDYLGDVPWEEHEPAKEWYARVKSPHPGRPHPGRAPAQALRRSRFLGALAGVTGAGPRRAGAACRYRSRDCRDWSWPPQPRASSVPV
jgi:glutathione S-transferase